MFWIEGIRRDFHGLSLEVLEPKGRHTKELKELSQSSKLPQTMRTRITTDCSTWTRDTGALFWQQLGIEAHQPKDGQGIFKLHADGKAYMIPASVFIAAMMRPIHLIQTYLFRPQGLESFCTPLLDSDEPQIGLHISSAKVFGPQHSIPKGLWATYSWMHCFPSANAMWSSVYTAACQGRLDVELPQARLTMTLRSIKVANIRLVTNILVTKLEALESPFSFAGGHTRKIVLHESAELDWETLHRPISAIPPRGGEWRLSDSEWEAIEPMFAKRNQEKFPLRDIIDQILNKLGAEHAWRKMDVGDLNMPIVQWTYQQLKKQGHWQRIETTLKSLRSTAAKPLA